MTLYFLGEVAMSTVPLSYHSYTDKGDLLPDFSFCGYKGGGVAIPHIKVTASISPSPNKEDDTPFIQAVIDKVAKLQPDEDGFRGCILLRKGVYHIASPIRITASGIVLRGEGLIEAVTFIWGMATPPPL